LGRYCFIGAGAVVKGEIPDYALMVGVPARRVGWMGRHGFRLKEQGERRFRCPETGWDYEETDGTLRCLNLDEESPLE
jgi:UDP-2-acetamido-3-amino-2,3-dideoxy-glucuronate N-acetyltransferase